jgi:hypothetical protein
MTGIRAVQSRKSEKKTRESRKQTLSSISGITIQYRFIYKVVQRKRKIAMDDDNGIGLNKVRYCHLSRAVDDAIHSSQQSGNGKL